MLGRNGQDLVPCLVWSLTRIACVLDSNTTSTVDAEDTLIWLPQRKSQLLKQVALLNFTIFIL